MELVETIVAGAIVRLRLADNADRAAAIESIDIVVKTGPDRAQPLTAIQADALLRAQTALTSALATIEDHLRRTF